jgi:hypothetical protein
VAATSGSFNSAPASIKTSAIATLFGLSLPSKARHWSNVGWLLDDRDVARERSAWTSAFNLSRSPDFIAAIAG